jgi:carbamoyltransferase
MQNKWVHAIVLALVLVAGVCVWSSFGMSNDLVVAIHMGAHDNTMVISRGPKIQLVLELERIFGVRYFEKSHDQEQFKDQWNRALEVARGVVTPGSSLPLHFKKAIFVRTYAKTLKPWMLLSLKQTISADQWLEQAHEESHALHALYDSGYSSGLIVTADADEHDGTFNIWWGTRSSGVKLLEKVDLNIALSYEYVGAAMDEMNSGKKEEKCWTPEHPLHCNKYAGTLMGYSALGKSDQKWIDTLRPLFLAPSAAEKGKIMTRITPFPTDQESQRTISASAQQLLEEYLIKNIERYSSSLTGSSGIIMSGDLALNVKANSAVQRYFKRPVWVPSSPSDDGVPIGAIWKNYPPWVHQELMYLGLPVVDLDLLPDFKAKYNGKTVTTEEVAKTLLEENIVGLMVGRQEVGPRALGHRSLFAIPTTQKMKDRLNKIKARQWFRPVAPTMNVDAVPEIFEEKDVFSPYMQFAPKLKQGIEKIYPAIYHYDGSARPQTVVPRANPELYRLLKMIGDKIGQPIVINTSFNTKGRPIINSLKEGIELLKTLEDLDYLLIENVMFSRKEVLKVAD